MKTIFEAIGWNVKLQQKSHQYFLTLPKEVALGSGLKKGDPLFYYLVNCENRKALLVFLDSGQRQKAEIVKLKGISYLIHQ